MMWGAWIGWEVMRVVRLGFGEMLCPERKILPLVKKQRKANLLLNIN